MLVSSPNLITCWLAGPVSSAYLKGTGWRWCFGTFAIIIPAITLPLFGLFLQNYYQARKDGLVAQREDRRTAWQNFLHYGRERGRWTSFTICRRGSFSPTLQPRHVAGKRMALSSYYPPADLRSHRLFRCMGEISCSRQIIPYSLLLDRTVFGTCILSTTLSISFFCWNSYFSSFLQVVNGLNVADASYVVQAYTVGTLICSLAVGVLIYYTYWTI